MKIVAMKYWLLEEKQSVVDSFCAFWPTRLNLKTHLHLYKVLGCFKEDDNTWNIFCVCVSAPAPLLLQHSAAHAIPR